MIWLSVDGILKVKHNKNGIEYRCEIKKESNGYVLEISHNKDGKILTDLIVDGLKTKDLILTAEEFLDS